MTPGALVGPYRLERLLGRGGMGEVWAAVDVRSGAGVALKLLPPTALPDLDARTRFEREARLSIGVRHPHVVGTLDVGVAGATAWLALELLPGGSLADRLKSGGALPWREAAALAAQAARGLDAAHASGLIHRDVKPANLLLDAEGRVRVADFGLVRRAVVDGTSRALTRTGEVVGTPEFLAPEQADGTRAIDRRADLYALGATLHALVAGRPPFTSTSILGLLQQHLETAPPPLRALVLAVPEELEALVLRLLAKRPDDRPSSAAEVAVALEAIARMRVRRRRGGRGPAVVGAALLVVAAVAGGLVLHGRAPVQPATPTATGAPTPPPATPPPPPATAATPPVTDGLGPDDETPEQEVRRLVRSSPRLALGVILGSPRWSVEYPLHLAGSADGRRIAVYGDHGALVLLDARTGRTLRSLAVPEGGSRCALDARGERVLLVLADAVVVFDVASGDELGRLASPDPSATFAGDAVVEVRARVLRQWRPGEARPRSTPVPGLTTLAVDAKGDRALFGLKDLAFSSVALWSLEGEPRELGNLLLHQDESILQVAIAPDGRRGWVLHDDGSVSELDLTGPRPTRQTVVSPEPRQGKTRSLLLPLSGGRLALGLGDELLIIGADDTPRSLPVRVLTGLMETASGLLVASDSPALALHRWKTDDREVDEPSPGHVGPVTGLGLSGDQLLSSGVDGRAWRWKLVSHQRDQLVDVGAPLFDVVALADGSFMMCGRSVWRVTSSGIGPSVAAEETAAVAAVGRVPGAPPRALVAERREGYLRVFDLGTQVGRSDVVIPTPQGPEWINDVAVDAEGRRGIVATNGGARLFTLDGVARLRFASVADLTERGALCAAVAGTDGWVGFESGTVARVDLARGSLVETKQPHRGTVSAIAATPSGRVATGSVDRTLVVWDWTLGEELGRLDLAPLGDRVCSLVWASPERLFAGTSRGVILEVRVSAAPR